MRERAERMKASFMIDSTPGRGTEISLSLPANLAYEPKIKAVTSVLSKTRDALERTAARLFAGSSAP